MKVVSARKVDNAAMLERAKAKAPDVPVVYLGKHGVKKLWDNYQVIDEVVKSHRLKFVIAAGTRDGMRCLHIREFYFSKNNGEWRAGKDGIVIPLKSPYRKESDGLYTFVEPLKEFMEKMPAAIKAAEEMELYDPVNAMYITPYSTRSAAIKLKEIEDYEYED